MDDSKEPTVVVGIARDVRQSGLDDRVQPDMYFTAASQRQSTTEHSLVIRSSLSPAALAVLLAAAVISLAVPAWLATRVDPILMLRQD